MKTVSPTKIVDLIIERAMKDYKNKLLKHRQAYANLLLNIPREKLPKEVGDLIKDFIEFVDDNSLTS